MIKIINVVIYDFVMDHETRGLRLFRVAQGLTEGEVDRELYQGTRDFFSSVLEGFKYVNGEEFSELNYDDFISLIQVYGNPKAIEPMIRKCVDRLDQIVSEGEVGEVEDLINFLDNLGHRYWEARQVPCFD